MVNAKREAQALANETKSVHLVYFNSQDCNPIFQICAASESWAYMGDSHMTVSRHVPKLAS